MYSGVQETMCSRCSHLQVCSLKEQFLNAQKAVDDVMVTVGERAAKRLRDFDWIKRVKLECAHFIPQASTSRDASSADGIPSDTSLWKRSVDIS